MVSKVKTLLLTMLVTLSFALGSLSTPSSKSNMGYGEEIPHGGVICVGYNKWTPQGYVIGEQECDDATNVLTNMGRNYTIAMLSGTGATGAMTAVGVGNGTTPAATNVVLNSEITDNGLARAAGTVTILLDETTKNATVNKVFTYTGTAAEIVNTTALFNSTTVAGSTMFIADSFTSRTLQTNDQINITAWYW